MELIKVRCQDTGKITRLDGKNTRGNSLGSNTRALHMVSKRGMCTCGQRETQEKDKGDSVCKHLSVSVHYRSK